MIDSVNTIAQITLLCRLLQFGMHTEKPDVRVADQ